MGKSAKFARIGKTKKERDQLKITKNSRTTNISKPSSTTTTPRTDFAKQAIKSTLSTSQQQRQKETATSAMEIESDLPTIKKQQKQKDEKKFILDGRVDYVSLLNSRRSAGALAKDKKRK